MRRAPREDQNLMGVPVNQVDPVVCRYEDPMGIGDQAVAPGGAEGAGRLEHDDRRVGALIGVDPALGIHGELAERGERRDRRRYRSGGQDLRHADRCGGNLHAVTRAAPAKPTNGEG